MASKKVRVAIIGVGNCASSLVQGVQFYKNAKKDEVIPGIMHTQLGDYHVRDIEFTMGIDVNINKVGKDLSEAIFAEPNNTFKFSDVPKLNVPVVRRERSAAPAVESANSTVHSSFPFCPASMREPLNSKVTVRLSGRSARPLTLSVPTRPSTGS